MTVTSIQSLLQPVSHISHDKESRTPRVVTTLSNLRTAIEGREWNFITSTLYRFPALASEWLDVTVRYDQPARLLPLHYSCTRRPPPEVIREILQADPETASYADCSGRLSLHWACESGGASSEVIDILCRYYPEGASRKEKAFGFLPLHVACFKVVSTDEDYDEDYNEVVRTLLDWYPDGASTVDSGNRLPLHVACRTGATGKVVASLLRANPDATKHLDHHDRLPIHLACCHRDSNSVEVLELLVQSNPEGLQEREEVHGFLPLHVACFKGERNVRQDVVETLLQFFPMGARIPDKNGNLPLHLACKANAPRGVIFALLNTYSDGACKKDSMGRLPLHWACHMGASKRTIQALLTKYPEGARMKESKYHYLPLHVACLQGASENVVQALLRISGESAMCKDKKKSLPLHLACKSGANGNVISMLVSYNRESVSALDEDGKTPKDILLDSRSESRNREEIVKILEGVYSSYYTKTSYGIPIGEANNSGPEKESFSLVPPYHSLQKNRGLLKSLPKPKITANPRRQKNEERIDLCVICQVNIPDVVLYPCGHMCLCKDCEKQHLKDLNNKCPVGRCIFEDAVRVY